MSFAEEYRKLYYDTARQIEEHKDCYYDKWLIKQQFELDKKQLIEKWKNNA